MLGRWDLPMCYRSALSAGFVRILVQLTLSGGFEVLEQDLAILREIGQQRQ